MKRRFQKVSSSSSEKLLFLKKQIRSEGLKDSNNCLTAMETDLSKDERDYWEQLADAVRQLDLKEIVAKVKDKKDVPKMVDEARCLLMKSSQSNLPIKKNYSSDENSARNRNVYLFSEDFEVNISRKSSDSELLKPKRNCRRQNTESYKNSKNPSHALDCGINQCSDVTQRRKTINADRRFSSVFRQIPQKYI